MASYLYNKFKEEMLQGTSWTTSGQTFRAQLCAGTQPLATAADPIKSQIANPATTSGGVINPSIDNPTFVSGIFKGDNVTFTSINGGGSAGSFTNVMIYNDTSNRLMALIDLPNAPIPSTGGDIQLQWDTGSTLNGVAGGGIFAV